MIARLPSGQPYAPPAGLSVLHADAQILVVDKPSGLLSVPGKDPGLEDCLEARVRAAFPDALLLHRLDMDTSGVMVFARTRLAQRHIAWQFEKRSLEKRYVARVWGRPAGDRGRVDLPLICDWPNRPLQMVCHARGKPSVTDWALLAVEGAASRLAVSPLTGRSHQIRVHLREIGHPILGDRFYATGDALAAADRLQLHAESLTLRHPEGGAWVSYTAPVPF
ncbi:RNA pseudouridine synthase [Halovulum dunhuangense]|uniref:Dual-specificity RNA pseudouridine synthase RluA n=1 Tax=Halovulum dunhuangense TaxID=1505036 RepID=A0A849KY71_9RHOB|nr:pseudouridine synthase [Halovulum dunhuangense]NNU78966.1 RNA pseudouridine synthase [Halovulum dunhuangense]